MKKRAESEHTKDYSYYFLNGYVIAIAVAILDNGSRDYHFMRMNGDGKWESKDGSTEAVVKDGDKSAENIMDEMGYGEFVGYYVISEANK